MDHYNPAGYGALSRPNEHDQPDPRHFPTEQWQQDTRDGRPQDYVHLPVSNDYPVHQPPAQIQRYQQQLQALNRPFQQPLQAWDRSHQQLAYQQRLGPSSGHYVEPYKSQGQYSQSPGYGSLQYNHNAEDYEYTNPDGSNIQPEKSYRGPQLMQQYTLPMQSTRFNGYLDPRRTRPPPQRSYSDEGFHQPNDTNYSNNTRPSAPQDQQILYTNGKSVSSMRLQAPQGQQSPYTIEASTGRIRSSAPQGQHAPYTNSESLNSTKPRNGQVKSGKCLSQSDHS